MNKKMTLFIMLVGIISMVSGCKKSENDKYREALLTTATMDQGIIKTEVSLQIDFIDTELMEEDLVELSKYRQFKMKSILNFDQDNDYMNEVILLIAGSGWASELLKDENDIWLKLPILKAYMNLRTSDYLNNLVPGIMLQDSLIQLCSLERELIANEWLSLFDEGEMTYKKTKIRTLVGEEKVVQYTQSIPHATITQKINDVLYKVGVLDQVKMIFQNYLDFKLITHVDSYVSTEGYLIRQVLHIEGNSNNNSLNVGNKEFDFVNEKEWFSYPIKDFNITVDIDFSELGQFQEIKVPKSVYDNIMDEAMFIRLINEFQLH